MTLPMRRARGGRVHGVEPTAILRREPLADMQELLNRIGGLIQPTAETGAERAWMPVAETDETDDAYVVRLELPGIAPDEIEIGIRDRELCVNGEVREEEEASNALRVRVGRFHYHTSLPSDVDIDNVEASMDEGILTLRIPKAQQSRGRRIEISEGRSERGRSKGGRSENTRGQGTS
jgi:HSP20 family protein